MRYAFYNCGGAAKAVIGLKVGQVPKPAPGEVLVRVMASGVNPSDVKSRATANLSDPQSFVVPHNDGAGVIEAVGEGVSLTRIGERVWLWNAQWKRGWGTAAEYISLRSEQAVCLPSNRSFEFGATLGVPWLTAWRAVHYHPGRAAGETMLIQGGAGAVGFFAVQLAKRAGFHVLATVSSDEKIEVARRAGADVVINYKNDDTVSRVAEVTSGHGVDRIVEVDLASNAPTYTKVLKPGGFVAAYGSRDWNQTGLPLRDWLFHGVELAIFIVYELPSHIRDQAIRESRSVLADPTFQGLIAATFSLERIVDAHEMVESGRAIGNIVVVPDQS